MSYVVKFKSRALKYLQSLDRAPRERIEARIRALAENPRGHGVIPLQGRDGYRARVGVYRIVFTIDDGSLVVLVLDIDHRRDVYR